MSIMLSLSFYGEEYQMQLRQNRQYIWLVAILLLATFMRLNGITAQSLWIDEGFTWNLTQYNDFFAILSRDVHPPLYFIMIDWWVEIAGTSELSLRYFLWTNLVSCGK